MRSNEVSSILALCMPGIGDSLFAVPALRAIKEVFPCAWLDVLIMFRGSAAKAVQGPTLLHTCALIERYRHFVSNDSALLHLARALDVESAGIFGPTNAKWVRMPDHECREVTRGLPCQPCFYYSPRHLKCREGDFRCLRDLTPETFAEQVLCTMDKEACV